MEIRKFLLGRGDFKSPREIIDVVKGYAGDGSEGFDDAEALLIFQTSTQQTWLVVTNTTLYCVLDDLNKSSTKVQWSSPATELKRAGQKLSDISVRDKNDRVGLLQIGKHKNWLYSKKLFAGENVVDRVSNILVRKMNSGEKDPSLTMG